MHVHGNRPGVFQGRGSRIYDFVARKPMRGLYRRVAKDIAESAQDNAAVLDVGTGPGVLLVELAQRRPDLRLTGIDLSPDMVATAERNARQHGATAQVGDVTDLPFPDRSFDLIVSSFSLHHWDHPEAAMPELARVLRPGGRVCIYDFRSAPFEALTDAARANGLFEGRSPQRTSFRTGIPFFPRCVRYVMA